MIWVKAVFGEVFIKWINGDGTGKIENGNGSKLRVYIRECWGYTISEITKSSSTYFKGIKREKKMAAGNIQMWESRDSKHKGPFSVCLPVLCGLNGNSKSSTHDNSSFESEFELEFRIRNSTRANHNWQAAGPRFNSINFSRSLFRSPFRSFFRSLF